MLSFLFVQVLSHLHVVNRQCHGLFFYEILLATFPSVSSTTTYGSILLYYLLFLRLGNHDSPALYSPVQ